MKRLTIEQMQNKLDISNPCNSLVIDGYGKNTRIKCGKCGKIFLTNFGYFCNNKYKTCVKCSRELQRTKLTDLDIIIQEVKNFGYIPLFKEFTGVHDNLLIMDKDGYLGEMPIVNLRKGAKISKFAKYNKYALTNLRHYCKMNNIDCIIPDQEYRGWDFPIKVCCSSCHREYTTTVTHFINDDQIQCLDCSGSKSNNEKIIENWLKENNIDFISQYKFKGCKNIKELPFDFYLPYFNICIEMDGEGHYFPTRFNGVSKEKSKKLFESTKARDKIKNQYCIKSNIKLIRISFTEIKTNEYKEKLSLIIH